MKMISPGLGWGTVTFYEEGHDELFSSSILAGRDTVPNAQTSRTEDMSLHLLLRQQRRWRPTSSQSFKSTACSADRNRIIVLHHQQPATKRSDARS